MECINYFLGGAFPRLPPEGFPVVEGQLPPGPGWLEGPRPPPLFPPEDPAEPEEEPDFGIENTSYQELYHDRREKQNFSASASYYFLPPAPRQRVQWVTFHLLV